MTMASDQATKALPTDASATRDEHYTITLPPNQVPFIELTASFTSDVCLKSGSPPFSVQLSFHDCEDHPVTLYTGDWLFRLPSALGFKRINLRDTATGKIIRMAQVEMCGITHGLKPKPIPQDYIGIDAGKTFTYGGVINKAPSYRLINDFLGKLEIGESYGFAIESDIELKWWARSSKEKVLGFLEQAESSEAAEVLFDLHCEPLALDLTGNDGPKFTLKA